MTDTPQPPVQSPYPEQSQASTVLVLGILSIVVCQILGPFAWKMGHDELNAISEGRRPPEGQGLAQAGKICGIVGTAFLGLAIIFLLFWLVALLFGFGAFVTEGLRDFRR
ncbi:MAG: DUF4190 domain-containing protein [Acidimicrobiia bacterium]